MWAVLVASVAFAQELAPQSHEYMPHGTLGDYTGPLSGLIALLLALDRFGLLRLGNRDRKEDEAETPKVAALGARVDHMAESLGHMKRQAEKSYRDRTEHAVLLRTMQASVDQLRADWQKARTEDRAEIAQRFGELARSIQDLK
jgi:hypothetical protein